MSAKWIYNEILHKMRVSVQISFWAARGLRADHRDHDCVCHELLVFPSFVRVPLHSFLVLQRTRGRVTLPMKRMVPVK